MKEAEHFKLALFFTRGMSLKTWDKLGMFDREVALYQQLQARSVQVIFVTYGDVSDLDYASRLPGIQILCNRWKLSKRWYGILLPWLHAPTLRRCSVIKTNQMNGADFALCAARLWHKPLVARCGYMWSDLAAHGGSARLSESRRAQQIEKKVFNSARKIVVTTPGMMGYIANQYDIATEKIRVIPNYVMVELFSPGEELEVERQLCFIGRLSEDKNPLLLIDACEGLDVDLVMVGDGPLRNPILDRARERGIRIRLAGNMPHKELPKILRKSALFLLVSPHEGHPKTLIEAMACGRPVIGVDTPGIRELIHHGETGWVCNSDATSLRAAIQELLARPELRAELGRNARQFAMENFALEQVVEMELEVLHEAIK